MKCRTDLALEAHRFFQRSAGETTSLAGVRAREDHRGAFPLTHIDILDEHGAQALGKPVGRYVTLDLAPLRSHAVDAFSGAAQALAGELRALLSLPEGACALVVGLGNPAVTPDALGPRTLSHLLVTRHLTRSAPDAFGAFRPVCALAPGVLASTGLESVEIVRGVVAHAQPACVIVIDALAALAPERLCAVVQLSGAGIVPGSGVGNARSAFDRASLGVPTVAIGVPTVIDADALGTQGAQGMIVTPSDIDARVGELARLIGTGVNLALHDGVSAEELAYYVG